MWQTVRLVQKENSALSSLVVELTESTSRIMILTVGALCYVGFLLSGNLISDWPIWLISSIVILTSVLSLRVLGKNLLLAQITWQVGLIIAITLGVRLFQQPELAFFYAVLPLMVVVTIGWPAGLLMEGVAIALAWWLFHGLVAQPPPFLYSLVIVAGGVLTGLLGWAVSYALLTAAQWSLFSLGQAQKNMEEACQHRGEVVRLLKSLDHAYHSLERANAALVAAWKAADEADRFKEEFVTTVSHELRTPLNLIIGFSEVMLTSPESYGDVQLPGPYRSDLNTICHSAKHLLALVDDVLDLARIERGKLPLSRDEADLSSLIAETTDMVRDYIVAKRLELRVNVPDGLPKVRIDQLRIRQVILNLLVNAVRFTERGWISVDVSRQGDEIMVRVTDSGQGIPEHDLPKVFEEFHSGDNLAAAWHGSTGLGLPISKKFVELHHGRMGVESTYSQGASFWFTLPCLPTVSGEEAPPGSRHRQQPMRLRTTERVIVVVHDDPYIPRLLQRHLDGYKVLSATRWEEGVALAENVKAIALVTSATEAHCGDLGHMLVVNCPLPSNCRAASALGAHDFLVKPVSRQDLMAAMDRLGHPVRRVLVVDDDPETVRLFRRTLRPRIPGQDCLEAYNGREALEIMQAQKPDLVLLDLVMPELDGWSVLEEMARNPDLVNIPTIVVSGKAQDQASAPLLGSIQLTKAEGFRLGETVQALEALFQTLAPGWPRPESTEPMPAEVPLESQVLASKPPRRESVPLEAPGVRSR
jgi:signal transduction histidine kinase/CheY-like chemotaxis protein